jgi:hypothetical protein
MPIVCEVPTHLNVSDTIVFGLGAHQLVRLAAGSSVAYLVWDQATALEPELRAAVAGLAVAAGVACALLQPGGRPLDRWALAGAVYFSSPRRFVWRREPSTSHIEVNDESEWADSVPELHWDDHRSEGATIAKRRRV